MTDTLSIDTAMPANLETAIASEPMWLQLWVLALVVVNLAAVCFVLTRQSGRWRPRPEALVILASFFCSAAMMSWLYEQAGYVRLLGLPHLVFWLPAYCWLVYRYRNSAFSMPFKAYLWVYFIIAGLSLIVDVSDVGRYLLGEQQPLHLR